MKKDTFVFLSLFFAFFCTVILVSVARIVIDSIDFPVNVEGLVLEMSQRKEEEPVFLKLFDDVKKELIAYKKDFLEANLAEMKIRLYRGGVFKKEVFILAKGNPKTWGGSAVGLYQIISGNRVGYSNTTRVYMPYALNYYGMYYLHGEPYYPWGAKLISLYSGGCLRLKNKDAKTIYEFVEVGMPVLVIDKNRDTYEYLVEEPAEVPKTSAQSYLVADLDSGFVFAEKDSKKQLPLASITKLMTATVVAENVGFTDPILVREEMLEAYGSTDGLEQGKWFKVVELLYPLLIESSNDAAEVLSYFLGREKTIGLMNEKTRAILMKDTEFVDPSGFDPKNVSTAQDLFYLARYVLNNRFPFLRISTGEEIYSFGSVDFEIENLWNKNIFIEDPTFVGGKTGYVSASKNTALFIFRLTTEDGKERNIAIILLGSENSKADAQRIYIWLQKNYFKE